MFGIWRLGSVIPRVRLSQRATRNPQQFVGEFLVSLKVYLGVHLNVCWAVSRPASARASARVSRAVSQAVSHAESEVARKAVQEVFPAAVRGVVRLVYRLQVTVVEGSGLPRGGSADASRGAVPGPLTPRENCGSGTGALLHIDGGEFPTGLLRGYRSSEKVWREGMSSGRHHHTFAAATHESGRGSKRSNKDCAI